MTECEEFGFISSSWTQKEFSPEFCIHCSIPLQTNSYNENESNEDFRNLLVERVSEILSSTSSSLKVPLSHVLSTIFKLNYLKAFTTTTSIVMEQQQQVGEEEEGQLSLCLNCSQVLTQLYHLYNDFTQLAKLDSYLSNKLCQLNQIMDHHAEKSINCDLKERLSINDDTKDDDDQSQDHDSTDLVNPNYSSSATTTTLSTTHFDREPRILLTRLPKKYLQMLPASSHRGDDEEILFSDNCASLSNDVDDEYTLSESIVIKTEDFEDDEELHPMNPTSGDDSTSTSQMSYKISKKKRNILTTTTVAAAAGNRKSKRIPRKKTLELMDEKIETEKGSGTKRKRKNTGLANLSKKVRIKNSKNQHSQHNVEHDPNSSNEDDDDEVKTGKASQKVQKGLQAIKKMTNKAYYVRRTKYANPCWYCSRTDFSSPVSCLEHTKKEHLSQLSSRKKKLAKICSRCSKICPNFKVFEGHLEKCEKFPSGVILPNLYDCPECSRSFSVKSCLTVHIQLVHTNERPFQCDKCPYEAKMLSGLKQHIRNIHSEEPGEDPIPVQCDECPKILKHKASLAWHKKSFHSPEGYRRYQESNKKRRENKSTVTTVCSDCRVDFFNRLAYVNHRRSVHADTMGRNFVCEQCGSASGTASNLRIHMELVHSEERPFLCQQCGMAFKSKSHLVRHATNTHTTEGRLRHNEKSKIDLQRRKLVARQLELLKQQNTTTNGVDQGASFETSGQQSNEPNDFRI